MSLEDIEVLPEIEAVRRRPGMYVDISDPLLANSLLYEALCCARDEALLGTCSSVYVTLDADGVATVRDDGDGLPLDEHTSGVRMAEIYLTKLFACASGKSTPHVAETTCKVGLAVLNGLSEWLRVRIFSRGAVWTQTYARGVAHSPLEPRGESPERGTEFSFKLDASVLPRVDFDRDAIVQWAKAEVEMLAITIEDRRREDIVRLGASPTRAGA